LLGAVLTLSSYPSKIDIDNRTGEGENIPAPDGVVAAPPLDADVVAAVEEPSLDVDVVAAIEEPSLDVDVLAVISPPEDALLVAATCCSAAGAEDPRKQTRKATTTRTPAFDKKLLIFSDYYRVERMKCRVKSPQNFSGHALFNKRQKFSASGRSDGAG